MLDMYKPGVSSGKKGRVLIVDDDPLILGMLETNLEDDFVVQTADSGEACLETIPYFAPDLVLLNIEMPGIGGFETCRRLQEERGGQPMPVIFVSSHNTLDKRLKAYESGGMAENELIRAASIRALTHLAETRDPETGNHILRTQGYVRLLATRLRDHPRFAATINDLYIKMLVQSAPLHDIGKVGIPDAILLKPGKLTTEEWEIMKTHTTLGSDTIEQAERDIGQPVGFLALAKEVARWHHERWDGCGYPDRLAGDDIPISARLMALADVFDALISKRVYKEAMTLENVREIIAAERGRQFDPDVADAFLSGSIEFAAIAAIAADHQGGGQ